MKYILHLCADTGSDTWPYHMDAENYTVIRVGADIGVENFSIWDLPVEQRRNIVGVYANPVCTEFSAARRGKAFGNVERAPADHDSGLWMVKECERIIDTVLDVNADAWHVIENPATGTLKQHLGAPTATYEPWHYGSPWTKRTALWGRFNMPAPMYGRFADVPLNPLIYVRPGRKPSMAWLHKSAFYDIPEFRDSGMPAPQTDAEMRSLCSQNFAQLFKAANP